MKFPAVRFPVNSWRRVLACASVTAIGACASAGMRSPGATVTRLDGTTIDTTALTTQIEALTRTANVQGLTVTIFNDAARVYSRAFGTANLPARKPLRTDTEIYGASLSKAVFSVLVMKLVEQGVLDLDKPLQDYVSEPLCQNRGTAWHEDLSDLCSDPRYRRITARMSLAHTTGLPNWRWFEPDQKLRIHFEPGARYSYSGEGMTFLQAVIQRITGKPLEELMQTHVFAPYGMTMSSYTWQPRFEADYAVGHTSDGKPYPKDKDNAARAPSTLETTTDDYAKFMAAVLRRDGLGEASWNEIFKPQVRIRTKTQFGPGASQTTTEYDPIELSYGLGWGLQRTPHGLGAFKEGHGDGFQHYSIVYPAKKLGVLLMSNSDNAEGIFGHLLKLTIGDTFTPLGWEGYVPYDRAPKITATPGATTVVVVRHAEKSTDDPRDPSLSAAGQERARLLGSVLKDAGVTDIYTTQYKRTRQTAEPFAQQAGISIVERPASAANTATYGRDLAQEILTKSAGKGVLVVGHSNTVPDIVKALSGTTVPAITDPEYDHIFVVVIPASGSPGLTQLRFGRSGR